MAKLSRIANVVVSLRTTGITQLSFSDALAFGVHNLSPERQMIITGADELLDMGMADTDPLYKLAQDWFSQIPSSRQLYIGRWAPAALAFAIGAVTTGTVFTIEGSWIENGVPATGTATYTAIGGDTAADVADELAAAMSTWPVTATSSLGVLTITPDAGVDFTAKSTGAGATTLTLNAPTETVAEALAAANGNWYGLLLSSRTRATVEAAANWAEANEKLFGSATAEPAALLTVDTTSYLAWLQQNQMFRSFAFYSATAADQYPEAAIMSSMFTFYPGQETWALKKLAGIAYDDLTEGQAQAVLNKNGNTFELFRNFAVTQGGKVGAGEWIDVIRFRDWLAEEVRVRVVSTMINADGKVAYTDPGIAQIGTAVRGALDLGVRRNGIAPPEYDSQDNLIPSYQITLPRSSEISFNDKANRVLNDVKATARLAGAIHVANVNISLSYTL